MSILKKQYWQKGVSLVEVMLYVAFLSIISVAIIPFLFQTHDSRQRQNAMMDVETNGSQLLQVFARDIRNAERILDPAIGQTGSVLALQTDDLATNPMIYGIGTGSLYLAEGDDVHALNSPVVSVSNLVVRNTSISSDRQSAQVSFDVFKTSPVAYSESFHTTVTLFPDDEIDELSCYCTAPSCDTPSSTYTWESCQSSSCIAHSDFACP